MEKGEGKGKTTFSNQPSVVKQKEGIPTSEEDEYLRSPPRNSTPSTSGMDGNKEAGIRQTASKSGKPGQSADVTKAYNRNSSYFQRRKERKKAAKILRMATVAEGAGTVPADVDKLNVEGAKSVLQKQSASNAVNSTDQAATSEKHNAFHKSASNKRQRSGESLVEPSKKENVLTDQRIANLFKDHVSIDDGETGIGLVPNDGVTEKNNGSGSVHKYQ